METKVKSNGQAKVNTVKADKIPKFVAGNPVNEVSNKAEQAKEESNPLAEQPKARETSKAQNEAPAPVQQQEVPKDEPSKKDIKASLAEKIAEQRAILERHIQLGDLLARKIRHRDNLSTIIKTLKAFEVNLKENEDETDGNHFQGCLLTIKDDSGETFSTKNPTIIQGVAEQVMNLCSDKLEEVEMDIVNMIPA